MLNITKVSEPDKMKKFKNKVNPQNWKGFNSEIKSLIKNNILKNEQTVNGIQLCVYCERKINADNSQIEHVKPKASNQFQKPFDKYENMVVSCISKNSCGSFKGNKYDERFIDPIENNPADFMTYNFATGTIVSKKDEIKERVKYTCEILNLNGCRELIEARKTILIQLNNSSDKGLDFIDYIEEFHSLIEAYKSEILHI
jgi:uncharacterized protein (TIGR02646 family)